MSLWMQKEKKDITCVKGRRMFEAPFMIKHMERLYNHHVQVRRGVQNDFLRISPSLGLIVNFTSSCMFPSDAVRAGRVERRSD